MSVPKDLSDIRNHLYAKLEELWRVAFWVAFGTQVFALLAVWVGHKTFLVIVALIAILAPIVINWLREIAFSVSAKADKCRRLIFYTDGLGRGITDGELAEVQTWVMGEELQNASFVSPYYSSAKAVGPNRLADITTESAFFTMSLAERVISRLWLVLGISLLLVIGTLYTSGLIPFTDTTNSESIVINVSKSAALVIAFLMSGDFALLIRKYSVLRDSSRQVFRECAKLRDVEVITEVRVLLVVEDYHLALAQAPPIPSRLYSKYRDELNDAYRSAHGK